MANPRPIKTILARIQDALLEKEDKALEEQIKIVFGMKGNQSPRG